MGFEPPMEVPESQKMGTTAAGSDNFTYSASTLPLARRYRVALTGDDSLEPNQ